VWDKKILIPPTRRDYAIVQYRSYWYRSFQVFLRYLPSEPPFVFRKCTFGLIAIIGRINELSFAKKAIEMLLEGANHSTVYRYLERERRKRKLEEYRLWK